MSRQVLQRNRVGTAVVTVPPFKPLPQGASRPMAQQPERQRLVVQQNSTGTTALKQMPSPSLAAMQEDALRQRALAEAKLRQQQRAQQEELAMQILKQQRQQQQEAMKRQHLQKVQFPQQALQTKRIQVSSTSWKK